MLQKYCHKKIRNATKQNTSEEIMRLCKIIINMKITEIGHQGTLGSCETFEFH